MENKRSYLIIAIALIVMMFVLVKYGPESQDEFEEDIVEEEQESPEEIQRQREILASVAEDEASYFASKVQKICDKTSEFHVKVSYKECTENEYYELKDDKEEDLNSNFYYILSFYSEDIDSYYDSHSKEELENMYGEEPLQRTISNILDEFTHEINHEIEKDGCTGLLYMRFMNDYSGFVIQSKEGHNYSHRYFGESGVVRKDKRPICGEVRDYVSEYLESLEKNDSSGSYNNDPYDVGSYTDGDEFAEEWAEEFADSYNGDYEDGYDDAYEYWEDEQ